MRRTASPAPALVALLTALTALTAACPGDATTPAPRPQVSITGGVKSADQPQGEGARAVGVEVGALASSGLAIVALDTHGNTTSAPLSEDGAFALLVDANASYTLNLLDTARNVYIGSFLYRSGPSVELALNVALTDIALGECQVFNGEVWCDNGFFDAGSNAVVELPTDIYGRVRATVHPSATDAALVTELLGGTTIEYDIAPNPLNKFHVAVTPIKGTECGATLVGVAERVGDERYLYTDKTYANATCQATVRFQAMCTMESATRCVGFLRVDIVSSGVDCTAYPPTHVAEPVTVEVIAPNVIACPLPATCSEHSTCESGVCNTDVGFCAVVPDSAALRFYVFDVGNGQSVLAVSPSGKTVLIDAGRPQSGRMVAAMVRRMVPRIDTLILSHFDADHAGGALPLILGPDGAPGRRGFDDDGVNGVDDEAEIGAAGSDDLLPGVVLDRGLVPMPNGFDDYARILGSRRREAIAGETLDFGDGATMTVLTVNGRIANATGFNVSDENERSVGVVFRYGEFSLVDLGDLPGGGLGTLKMEQAVLPSLVNDLPIDVHFLSHHGSKASSPAEFLKAIRPRVAVISVGDSDRCGAGFNSYGLPAQEALDNLAAAGAVQRVYQTGEGGASFTGNCLIENNQIYPRDYGVMEVAYAYSVFMVEAYEETFRVSGLTFDDDYDAVGCFGEACSACPIGYIEAEDASGNCIVDPCLPDPCHARGVCSFVGPGEFACACSGNWGGEVCDACATGYAGEDCAGCAPGYVADPGAAGVCVADPCAAAPCGGNGACAVLAGGAFSCTCDGNWAGAFCDGCVAGYAGETCAACAAGYVEDPTAAGVCIVDPCAGEACGGHGVCAVLGAAAHRCDCEGHWSGAACDACAAGYAGADCASCAGGFVVDPGDAGACTADLCTPNACGGRGACTMVAAGELACACDGHFAGPGCAACAEGYAGVGCDECAAGAHLEAGVCVPDRVITGCAVATPGLWTEPGETAQVVGTVAVDALTAAEGRLAGVTAQVCWRQGSVALPLDLEDLTCAPAEYLADLEGGDAYDAPVTFPTAGAWSYLVAFSGDGGASWTACDRDGVVAGGLNAGVGAAYNVPNGGFEIVDSALTGWATDSGLDVEAETEVVHTGARAARLTRATTVNADSDLVAAAVAVTPGASYTVSLWIFDQDASARANVIYAFYDAAGEQIGATSYGGVYSTDLATWQNITRAVTAPANAATVRISTRVYAQSGGAATGGSVVLDDVAVIPGAL